MIPNKLWNNEILYQSENLLETYKNELISLGMLEYAQLFKGDTSGAIGGENEEETIKHFSERFLTSSARMQFLVLDPKKYFSQISKDLHSTFSSGNISILDIPSGTGAGVLSLLFNISELRNSTKLPRLPLNISIFAGDYSESALNIYCNILESAKLKLERELIYIKYDRQIWDASDIKSTTSLMKKWLKNEEKYEEFYILMSAFSGVGSDKYKTFAGVFDFIQNFVSDLHCTTILIEPNTHKAKSFLAEFAKSAKKWIKWLIRKEETTNDERFQWKDSVTNNIAKSGVLVNQYSRV
ncbi:hypothetical protein [Arcobacter sp. s6]|uniref:hypothetical protein n=1 Tax=Arcobacter sp. s6 TaxID=3230363 RepID=UPI00349FE61A